MSLVWSAEFFHTPADWGLQFVISVVHSSIRSPVLQMKEKLKHEAPGGAEISEVNTEDETSLHVSVNSFLPWQQLSKG